MQRIRRNQKNLAILTLTDIFLIQISILLTIKILNTFAVTNSNWIVYAEDLLKKFNFMPLAIPLIALGIFSFNATKISNIFKINPKILGLIEIIVAVYLIVANWSEGSKLINLETLVIYSIFITLVGWMFALHLIQWFSWLGLALKPTEDLSPDRLIENMTSEIQKDLKDLVTSKMELYVQPLIDRIAQLETTNQQLQNIANVKNLKSELEDWLTNELVPQLEKRLNAQYRDLASQVNELQQGNQNLQEPIDSSETSSNS